MPDELSLIPAGVTVIVARLRLPEPGDTPVMVGGVTSVSIVRAFAASSMPYFDQPLVAIGRAEESSARCSDQPVYVGCTDLIRPAAPETIGAENEVPSWSVW